jgi:hypothetical protein
MSNEKTKVLYDSPEAAKRVTVTGWVSIHGRFYGESEHYARYDSYTHRRCECGNEMERAWLKCKSCRGKADNARYNALPYKEWNGLDPVCLRNPSEDDYFFSEEDFLEWCEVNERDPEQVELLICKENLPKEVTTDYWEDQLPADREAEDCFSKEMINKLKELNDLLLTHKPISYSPGKFRTSYKP